ncbi:MAG: DUF4132 domain-containing protein, partial [Planctomycetes bacterium]|nr:DUF4132 domain-containing protein [Planctomycetota bacterium]
MKPPQAREVVLDLIARFEAGVEVEIGRRLETAIDTLTRRQLPLDTKDLQRLLQVQVGRDVMNLWHAVPVGPLKTAERLARRRPLPADVRALLATWADKVLTAYSEKPQRDLAYRMLKLAAADRAFPINPGEAWSDALLEWSQSLDASTRAAWADLLEHAAMAKGGKPTAKWRKTARSFIAAVGNDSVATRIEQWLLLVDRPRTLPPAPHWRNTTDMLDARNADLLKGLVWCIAELDEPAETVAAALSHAAIFAYRKVPGMGIRNVALGNACVWALGQMPGMTGIGQLALLRVRVRFLTAQKGIDKALAATAERVGVAAEELEEIGVPDYGLQQVGLREERLGTFVARLLVTGTASAELQWIRPDGKQQKSVPKAIKDEHADALAELKATAKEMQRMLPAQRDRIDNLFLSRTSWPIGVWRERYRDHPLVGTLARRLVWVIEGGGTERAAMPIGGAWCGADGEPIAAPSERAVVRLWHPIESPAEDVAAWRRLLTEREIRQPFKQAHREVYLLTDAERATDVYSNRFAAHLLKQHQFHALCQARGWRNRLRLAVDDDYPPPYRELPRWQLRAEYWIESAGDSWNESGVYDYVATDQVRFYHVDAV